MSLQKKIGILGAGQLGKMLAIEAARMGVQMEALDSQHDVPAAPVLQKLHIGHFNNYEDVLHFGRQMDVVGIEIEHVNTDALRQLQSEGIQVIPNPDVLDIIKDKGKQKTFYKEHELPTAAFDLYESAAEILAAIDSGKIQFPFVQKSRTAGYDGKGVAVIKNKEALNRLMDTPSVIESAVDIDKELAIIACKNESGEVSLFPVVEMLFNPDANLVENLICPAAITAEQDRFIQELATQVMQAFDMTGLLAIELFLSKNGDILINEVAPRPHNSGHHTIEACYTCQYQQQLRALLNLPLGSTRLIQPAMMLNVLGAAGFDGPAHYSGVADILKEEGIFVHLYGKTNTKPFRKMGHVTITADSKEALEAKAALVRKHLKVISQ